MDLGFIGLEGFDQEQDAVGGITKVAGGLANEQGIGFCVKRLLGHGQHLVHFLRSIPMGEQRFDFRDSFHG